MVDDRWWFSGWRSGGGGAYFRFQNPVHRPKNAGKRHDCGRRRKIGGGGGAVFFGVLL